MNNATNATMRAATYRIETFYGVKEGWRPASPAVVDAATAARRLRLYRAVRGHARLYRIADA